MKKKFLTIMLAGTMAAGMSAGSVQAAAAEDASGDLYVFIAASLSNAMEDIQKDFNKEYPDVNILLMQTVQEHFRYRLRKVPDVTSFSPQLPNRWMHL